MIPIKSASKSLLLKWLNNIEMLTQKVEALEEEKAKLLKKAERLKRNYDGLSFATKNEKSEFIK